MGKIFSVGFQTKYVTHTLKDTMFIQCWKFKSSQIYELVCVVETTPRGENRVTRLSKKTDNVAPGNITSPPTKHRLPKPMLMCHE